MRSLDDDPSLAELLPPISQQRLMDLLQELTGQPWRLTSGPVEYAAPVEFNLATTAWLSGPADRSRQAAAARLLEFILLFVGKYRLAAHLHHDATEASFAELTLQNEALRASEARYRTLSDELQKRVDVQVKQIARAQLDLYQSAHLRSVGQLAAGVAHEINNPISFIGSNLRVAADYLEEIASKLGQEPDVQIVVEDFRALLSESLTGANRVGSIVTSLKTFSNIDQSDFVACDINALLRAACDLAQTECVPGMRISLALSELPRKMGYPAKLSQAFYNVLDNAVKAHSGPGQIDVRSAVDEVGLIRVRITDQGCGMVPEVLARVYEPFYTTRGVGAGMGLGLTVVRDIVLAHRGDIHIQSRVDEGTQVDMKFPKE